jgi:plastocyanin
MEISGKISAMAVALGASILIILILIAIPTSINTKVSNYSGVKREFYMFDSDDPVINETALGMPHDTFSIPAITVMRGDMVVLHFYNVETVKPDSDPHSFTIWDKHYNINVIVKPGENKTITFNATTSGVFPYICTFHQPTMTGQLVVLEPTS